MVTLELQSTAAQQRQSDTFQQVDPVAALQQLVIQYRTARVASSRAAQQKRSASNSPHPLCSASYSSKKQPSADARAPRCCSSNRAGSTPHQYTNDGVRLSELGEQPLAIGTAEPLVSKEGELSFSLQAAEGVVVSYDGVPDAAGEAGHTQHRKYVCSTKDDPLVKGRPALPDLFRQKGAFSLLQPSLGSEISFSQLDSQRSQQQPVLLVNLQAFLAEKLQMADRLQAAYGLQDRSSLTTANLVLDAHRQVFEAFIHSFTTYRPLLLKVRAAYEEALQDALTSQADNIHMKAQLAVLHQRKADAIDKARGSGNDAAVSGRGALYERLVEAQGRQEQAAASAAAEEAANAAATAELRAARAEAADLKLRIMKARSSMLTNSSFAQKQNAHVTTST
ncbi:TPA: hypothetical protein ACH3X1_009400 [Trebouxia sp. C0004]